MIKNEILKTQKLHNRQINIATYKSKSESFIVEGILKDERWYDSYRVTGEFRPAGTIHDLIIRLKIKSPELVIEDIEVEMPKTPNEECVETLHCLDPVKGLSVVSGFTSKVRKLVGGAKGCFHLLSLLTTMAPAVLIGVPAKRSLDKNSKDSAAILYRLKNTCWVWRENGASMKKLRKLIR